MKIGAILPHLKLFGGVKRYLELGNVFVDMGHQFTIYVPEKDDVSWFTFRGKVDVLSTLIDASLDAIFTSEEVFLNNLILSKAGKKIFYVISKNKALKEIVKNENITLFANSSTTYRWVLKKTGVIPFKAFGGIDIESFSGPLHQKQDDTINILTYGRQMNNNVKGTNFVTGACELLYKKGQNIKLLLFDTPVDDYTQKLIDRYSVDIPYEFIVNHPVERNRELFNRADIFASAERKGGWSNTCAEAMASGVPVVATKIGTEDFLFNNKNGFVIRRNKHSIARALQKLIHSEGLRKKFAENGIFEIGKYDWKIVAHKIIDYLSENR